MNLRRICSALLVCAPLTVAAETNQAVTPLVTIDDFAVTNMHYAVFASQNNSQSDGDPEKQIELLNELVNIFMVANSAEGKKLASHPEIEAAIAVSNARLVAQALIRDKLESAQVSDAEVEAAYQSKYAGIPNQEFKAAHILLETEEEAKAVIEALQQGGNFTELAKEKSIGPSKSVGGDLGWFSPSQMVAPFSKAVSAMDDGSFSQTPVQTKFGWHVIQRNESRNLPTPSMQDVRAELEKELRTAKLTSFIRNLRDSSKIEVISGDAEVTN